jgi:hypothetical protein
VLKNLYHIFPYTPARKAYIHKNINKK